MLDDTLVKQELQKLINENFLDKKITDIWLNLSEGKYVVTLDNKMKVVIGEDWVEDYLDGKDINRKAQIIQSIRDSENT